MSGPIVVAHLIASNFYGGPEKQILTHARYLDPARFRFVLVPFVEQGRPNEILQKAEELGIESAPVQVGSPFDPRAVGQLRRIFLKEQASIVCSHGYKANVLGRLATWSCGIPQIAISRGWTAESRKIRLYECLDKLFLRFDNHVVAVSHGQKEKIVKLGIRPRGLSVIHNAIALQPGSAGTGRGGQQPSNPVKKQLGIPDHAFLVASAGRLSPEKNYGGMIEVARKICSQRNDVFFAVFGEGFLRAELERSIRRAGLLERFFLPGFRKDIQQVFDHIDIFMLPSFTEGLPNVALEAFAAQKPIIASRVGGTPEVVQDGISGFLTAPEQYDLMARHLLCLLDDPQMRRDFGTAGYAFISKHFGFMAQTAVYQQLYLDIHKA